MGLSVAEIRRSRSTIVMSISHTWKPVFEISTRCRPAASAATLNSPIAFVNVGLTPGASRMRTCASGIVAPSGPIAFTMPLSAYVVGLGAGAVGLWATCPHAAAIVMMAVQAIPIAYLGGMGRG